jgi:hypothetical protein
MAATRATNVIAAMARSRRRTEPAMSRTGEYAMATERRYALGMAIDTEPGATAHSALARRMAMVAALVACVGGAFYLGTLAPPSRDSAGRSLRPTPSVVLAVRSLSRLETTSYHLEKVIELTDAQSKLFGLVEAKDVILLVAVADVVAGVDLSKVTDRDAYAEGASGVAHVKLPAPEVFSSSLDEAQTHVYARKTDVLAARNEKLEGLAREEAEKQMRQAAIDAGVLVKAKANAEDTVRGLLRSLGFARVEIEWGE